MDSTTQEVIDTRKANTKTLVRHMVLENPELYKFKEILEHYMSKSFTDGVHEAVRQLSFIWDEGLFKPTRHG